MNIEKVIQKELSFELIWSDGHVSEAPFIWLRDNHKNQHHRAHARQAFDLTSVPLTIKPKKYQFVQTAKPNDTELIVHWPDIEALSHYSAQWLFEHKLGSPRFDSANIERCSWANMKMDKIPRFLASQCASSATYLMEALTTLKQTGIILIDGLEDTPEAGEQFAGLISSKGHKDLNLVVEKANLNQTNEPSSNTEAQPLHTDFANHDFVVGNQLLHCYRNDASGGELMFTDAIAVLDDFKVAHPGFFKVLCDLRAPWCFSNDQTDVRIHRPVISLDHLGQFKTLTFNALLADTPDFKPQLMYSFYAAIRELKILIQNYSATIHCALKRGEMVIFDNQSVLNGRAAFKTDSGSYHFQRFYLEHKEFDSRIRMLHKQLQQNK